MTIKGKLIDILKDFQRFIMRGNVVDLAVGIVVGAAFTGVVNALVRDLFTPLIAAIFKQPDFSAMTFIFRGSKFNYGDFLNSLISFLIVAAVVYFFVVLPLNSLVARMRRGQTADPTTKKCPYCLSDIPVKARRCQACTSFLEEEPGPNLKDIKN